MKRHLRIIPILLVIFFVFGCVATQEVPMTEQDYYDEAAGWWLDTQQSFKQIYLTKTEAEQKEYLPFLKILHQAKEILDLWQMKIDGGVPADNQIDQWKAYKNDLIMMIYNNYREKD